VRPHHFINRSCLGWSSTDACWRKRVTRTSRWPNAASSRASWRPIWTSSLWCGLLDSSSYWRRRGREWRRRDVAGRAARGDLRARPRHGGGPVSQFSRVHRAPTGHQGGLAILRPEQLNPEQKGFLNTHFSRNVWPVLTPLAVDQGHPFPVLRNRSLNLAIVLRKERQRVAAARASSLLCKFRRF